jgi:hypothetical protein
MGRILIWILVGFVAAIAYRVVTRPQVPRRDGAPSGARSRRAPPALAPSESMVACAVCGLHVPRSEAVAALAPPLSPASAPVWYCSEAHRSAGQERR